MAIIVNDFGDEPVTLAEMKAHSRIDLNEEDALILSLIKTAREYCETFTGKSIVQKTVSYVLDRWPRRREIHLPRPPIIEIMAVTYLDEDGVVNDLVAGTDYIQDDINGKIVLRRGVSWPTDPLFESGAIQIAYIAGYNQVPESIRAAVKLCAAAWYENREAVLPAGHVGQRLPMGVEALLWQDRAFWTEDLNE